MERCFKIFNGIHGHSFFQPRSRPPFHNLTGLDSGLYCTRPGSLFIKRFSSTSSLATVLVYCPRTRTLLLTYHHQITISTLQKHTKTHRYHKHEAFPRRSLRSNPFCFTGSVPRSSERHPKASFYKISKDLSSSSTPFESPPKSSACIDDGNLTCSPDGLTYSKCNQGALTDFRRVSEGTICINGAIVNVHARSQEGS